MKETPEELVQRLGTITFQQFLLYARTNLAYLDGMAAGLESPKMHDKVNSFRSLLNQYEGSVLVRGNNDATCTKEASPDHKTKSSPNQADR